MAKIAIDGDQGSGVCNGPNHAPNLSVTVTLHGNSGNITEQGKQMCLANCTVTASCGHQGNATNGSTVAKVNGIGFHRVGDGGVLPGGGYYSVDTSSSLILNCP